MIDKAHFDDKLKDVVDTAAGDAVLRKVTDVVDTHHVGGGVVKDHLNHLHDAKVFPYYLQISNDHSNHGRES